MTPSLLFGRAPPTLSENIGPTAVGAVPALAAALNDPEPAVQWRAADALVKIGPEAVPALAAILHSSNPDFRWRAVDVLVKIGPDAVEAVPALTAALSDPNPDVRACTANLLARLRNKQSS